VKTAAFTVLDLENRGGGARSSKIGEQLGAPGSS
jgi:hypothetical protein